MKSKLIQDENGAKTFALIFDTGDEAMSGLVEFAKSQSLGAANSPPSAPSGTSFWDISIGKQKNTNRIRVVNRSRCFH